jgi:hypothetical protein
MGLKIYRARVYGLGPSQEKQTLWQAVMDVAVNLGNTSEAHNSLPISHSWSQPEGIVSRCAEDRKMHFTASQFFF